MTPSNLPVDPAAFPLPIGRAAGSAGIPKRLMRIWLDDPLPKRYERYGEMWDELHPGWLLIDWRSSASLPDLINQDIYDRAEEFYPDDWKRFQADLVRLELLWEWGGVYVDCDIEPLRNVEPLLEDHEVVVGRSPQKGHPITNAFMAAVPGHPFIADLIETLPAAAEKFSHRPLAKSIGPWHLTRIYDSLAFPESVTVIDDLYTQGWFTHHWANAKRKRRRPGWRF